MAVLRTVQNLRIIPARAGFTQEASGHDFQARDHPRACGVYRRCVSCLIPRTGSSPRVRGLPATGTVPAPEAGIIPARAGFTVTNPVRGSIPQDHPRACGVYDTTALWCGETGGSSPRVRGLRPPSARRRPGNGIIPARAGFTTSPAASRCSSWDHPRACGVYGFPELEEWLGDGSSPRVRGLLLVVGRSGSDARIIPARAGFT